MNYTVFDVETANSKRESICSIGIIRCENENVIYEKEILINPEVEFNYFNTRIHGITGEMVKDAPTFPEIWDEIRPYFSNTILVAHNARSMALCAIYRTLSRYNLPMVSNQYICTLELSRTLLKNELESFKLNVVSNYFGINLEHHHDALCDTRACYEILCKIKENYPEAVIPQQYYYTGEGSCDCKESNAGLEKIYRPETKDMQELQVEEISLQNKKVCLSGEFDFGSKKEVESYINSLGGEVVKSVTSKIDILILGEAGSAAWKYGNYGSKYERARQLIEKGKDIKIYKERDILSNN